MFEFLCFLTGLVLIGGGIYAYKHTRDGMHPAIILFPPFVYVYVSGPILANLDGGFDRFFSADELVYVATLYLATAMSLYAGLLRGSKLAVGAIAPHYTWSFLENPVVRKRMFGLSVVLGLLAIAAYWHSLENAGGFIKAYSQAKGGGTAESGYIGEATLLSFPAIILLALSRRGLKLRASDMGFALFFALPHLLHGTFGGRRGPMFLVIGILFIAWFIARGRAPSLKLGLIAVCVAGLAVVLVWSQRKDVYYGSDGKFNSSAFLQRLFSEEPSEGSTYVVGAATVLTADYSNHYYWGYRYFVTLFVRPVPKQLWPTKYEDMGADWLYRYGDEEREFRYTSAVGFTILAGSATGSFADGYMEFWWGVLLLFFFIGALYAKLWRLHRTVGGFWSIIFAVAAVLSIYLATQSVTAWGTRFVFVLGFTYLLWRFWLKAPISPVLPRTARPQQFARP